MKTLLVIICATGLTLSFHVLTPGSAAAGNEAGAAQTASAPSAGTLSDQDRAALVDQLTKTKQAFIDSIRGLSDAQWRFKPNPFKWSVAECADHIIMSEDYFMATKQRILQTPAQSRPADQAASQDKALETFVADRSHKVFNPDALAPKGKFSTPAEAIAEFTSRRDNNIEYVKTTKDDLRAHSVQTVRGTLDAYEFLLLMATHSGRHTAQIQEVKTSPKYPAS